MARACPACPTAASPTRTTPASAWDQWRSPAWARMAGTPGVPRPTAFRRASARPHFPSWSTSPFTRSPTARPACGACRSACSGRKRGALWIQKGGRRGRSPIEAAPWSPRSHPSHPLCPAAHTLTPILVAPPLSLLLLPPARQEFGNNPDTSKALRCLVTEGELQREGRGGRKDPFSYTLTAHPRPASSDAGAGRGDDTGPAPRALRSGGQDSGADAGVVSRAPRGPELGPPAPAPAPRSQRTAARQAAAQGAGHATARQAAAPCAPPQRQRSTPVQDEEDALWSALARVKRRRRTALAPASTCDSSASEAAAPPPAAAPPAAHPPAQAQAWAAHASGHMHAPGHAQRPGHSQAQGHPQAPPHAQAPPRAAARPASPGRPPLSTLPGGLHEHAVLNAYFSAAVVRQRAQQAAAAEAHHAAWMHPSALPPSFLHAGGVAMPTVPHHGAQRPPADGQAAHKALPRVNPYLAAQLYWQMTGGGGGGRP
uniref:Uncharacterized protein n=1 Tax=Auxenochlorella protothecoides TaxID=3075 RepID=A0A1D2A8D5_AUXPR